MTMSVLVSSQYIMYRMAYDDSTHSRRHYHYINLDVRPHFITDVHGYFLYLCCAVLFLWMNMYVYDFFLTIFSYFVSMLELITSLLDSTLPIFPTICTILGLFFIGYISSEGRNFLSGRKSSK